MARHWQAIRADPSLQFAPLDVPPPPETPQWLQRLGELLAFVLRPIGQFLSAGGPYLPWIVATVGVLLAAWLVWRARERVARWLGSERVHPPEAPWQPDVGTAEHMLQEADPLAAQGRFDEAVRLLLRRSVGLIAGSRPGLLEPSSTAREIASLPVLSDTARVAFGIIAERVEWSLFARHTLDAGDWQAARAAYARFAQAAPVTAE